MPMRVLALMLVAVTAAAGATIWLATLLPGSGVAILFPLALIGALALRALARRR